MQGTTPVRVLRTALVAVLALLAPTAAAHAGYAGATSSISDAVIASGGTTTYGVSFTGTSTTTQTPTDIVLVLDESGSISTAEFAQMRTFSQDLVTGLEGDGMFAGGGRMGVVRFASGALVSEPLTASADAVRADLAHRHLGGATCISCGLDTARTLLGPPDPARNRLVILLTDGVNSDSAGALNSAIAALESAGVERYAVGIGNGVDMAELNNIASDPDSQHVFTASGFGSLSAILEGLVEAVVAPGETGVAWTFRADPSYEVVGATASKGTTAVSGQDVTWSLAEMGDETQTLAVELRHRGEDCDDGEAVASHAYTSDQGSSAPALDPQPVTVQCAPVCAEARPSIERTARHSGHLFEPVTIEGVTDPDGDPVDVQITSIRQDEGVLAKGSGRTSPDGRITGDGSVAEVRAERVGGGNGRVYTIAYTASDDAGGSCDGSVAVAVPHDASGRTAVDDGPAFDSTVAP